MNKRELRTRPVLQATERMIESVRSEEYITWMLRATEYDGILTLTVYDRKDLLEGKTDPHWRIFCDIDGMDFITQDMKSSKTKWLTGAGLSCMGCHSWHTNNAKESYDNIAWDSMDTKELMVRKFEKYRNSIFKPSQIELNPDIVANVISWFTDWQQSVVTKRRHDREYKELEFTDRMMDMVPELPERFGNFIEDEVYHWQKYLIYDAGTSKRYRDCYCTSCNQHLEVDTNKFQLRRWKQTKCPSCGSDVFCQSIGLWHEKEQVSKRWAVVQNVDGMILVRRGRAHLNMITKKFEGIVISYHQETEYYEDERNFFSTDGKLLHEFEHGIYKTLTGTRWHPTDFNSKYRGNSDVLMMDEVEDILQDTAYKYSGIVGLQYRHVGLGIPVMPIFRNFKNNPESEYLIKCGYRALTTQYLDTYFYGSGPGRYKKQMEQLMKMPKMYRNAIREANATFDTISFVERIGKEYPKESFEAVKSWVELFGTQEKLWHMIHDLNINTMKFIRWAEKNVGIKSDGPNNFARDYMDYYNWCIRLKYDMHDTYYSMPPKFRRAHDNAMNAIIAIEDAQKLEKLKAEVEKTEAAIKKMMKSVSGSGEDFKLGSLMIKIPKSPEDLKNEGATLHHCVATYIDRVAKGETQILFVRKISEPDKPYYTMEWNNNRIVQCRGMRNCDMTDQVKIFTKCFEFVMTHPGQQLDIKKVAESIALKKAS